jgi:hypothetical protein
VELWVTVSVVSADEERRQGWWWESWLATLQEGEGEAPIGGRVREGREVVDGLSVDARFML